MRKQRNRVDEETEVNLTPMLDVTFIMLIFFIVTASFVKEAGVDVNRQQASTCLLYTSPSPRDQRGSRMPSSA